MEIRWLPRKSRRKTQPASPRGWKRSALIGDRVPQSRAHIWRLGPRHHELERVVDLDGNPVVLHSHAKLEALAEVIPREGFYRVVLRSREGAICGRRDFQAAWSFPSNWDPATARRAHKPRTVNERLAAERDALRDALAPAQRQCAELQAACEAAQVEVAEAKREAAARIAKVRAAARDRIAEAERDREALELLLAQRDAELRRVRDLYVRLADESVDADDDESGADDESGSGRRPTRRSGQHGASSTDMTQDVERIAEVVLRLGRRLGFVSSVDEVESDDEAE